MVQRCCSHQRIAISITGGLVRHIGTIPIGILGCLQRTRSLGHAQQVGERTDLRGAVRRVVDRLASASGANAGTSTRDMARLAVVSGIDRSWPGCPGSTGGGQPSAPGLFLASERGWQSWVSVAIPEVFASGVLACRMPSTR